MVYESDFYTTRRPYRATPSLSTYTITSEPSRQVRILPGLGKVHFVHTYDRIVPYVGHKRLTLVTSPPSVIRLRPSTLYREFDRIENKLRPYSYNSYTNDYLNSESSVRIVYLRNPISSSYPVYRSSSLYSTRYYPNYSTYSYYPSYLNYTYPYNYNYYYPYNSYYPYYTLPTTRFYPTYSYYPSYKWYDLALYPSWRYNRFSRIFDDETRLIRAQTASLLQRIHDPVPRQVRSFPLPYVSKYEEVPARLANDNYIHRMLLATSPSTKSEKTVYWTEPVRKYFGQGHLSCVTLVGDKSQLRRRNVYTYQDPVRHDIQLLSYYINKFRDEKASLAKPIKVKLSPIRPSRIFSVPRPLEDPKDAEEMVVLREERAARLAKITLIEETPVAPVRSKPVAAPKKEDDSKKKASEEAAKKKAADEAAAKKKAEEAAKKAEEEKKAEAAKKAEEAAKKKAADEEAAKKKAADEEAAKKAEEEAAKKKAEEEVARKAKEAAEKAAELERLAEQVKQEELAKQAEIEKAKKEEEERAKVEEEKRAAEAAKAEEERQQLLRLEEIARQAEDEKEAELARQAEELAEMARQEAELAEQAKQEESNAEQERKQADHAEIEKKEAELQELEAKEKELTELAEKAKQEAEEAQKSAEEAIVNETSEAEPIVEEPQTPEETAAAESEPAAVEEVQE